MNPYEVAGEYGQRGLMDVLGIYQQHQNQKRLEMQQQADRQMRAQDMADRAEQREAQRKLWQDQENQRLAAADTARAQVMDPNTPVEQLPASWVETKTVKAPSFSDLPDQGAEFAGPQASDIQIGTQDKFVKTPKKYVEHGGYIAPIDLGGVAAQKRKTADEQSGWVTAPEDMQIGQFTFKAGSKIPPAMVALAERAAPKPQFEHGPGGAIYSVGKNGELELKVAGKEPAASAADRKAAQDEQTNAMLDSIVPDDPNTIPQQYRDMVVAFTEGRGIKPRAGTNVNLLQQMAWKYKPTLNMQSVEARGNMLKDLVKGSQTTRGGQITSLNTLANHLDKLQAAADTLGQHMYSSPSSTVNWAAQKLLPSGARQDIAAYQEMANAVKEEYIRALKGASPTDTELKQFTALSDPTLAPSERQAHIDALKELAAGRANAQEEAFQGAFGTSSTKYGQPMFGSGWVWDGTQWKLGKRGAKGNAKTSGTAPADPLGMR